MFCKFFSKSYMRTTNNIISSRGKKIFRKFDNYGVNNDHQDEVSPNELDAELDTTVTARLRGPLTRSAIKPRLLFPTAEQIVAKQHRSMVTNDEEEAATDIDELFDEVSSPTEQDDDFLSTPKAPRYAPVSQAITTRATRSAKKAEGTRFVDPTMPNTPTPEEGGSGSVTGVKVRHGKTSPFSEWRRIKGGTHRSGKKREGEAMAKISSKAIKRQHGGRDDVA